VVTLWLAVGSLCVAAVTARHPIHTSVAELREASGSVEVSIRVFPDDLERAVPGGESRGPALASYVARAFSISDRDGRQVRLHWKGVERNGDVLVIMLRSDSEAALSGATVSHGLLLDRFENQVNVVRASYGGRTTTLLFLPGDAAKRLP
jgi:hypothetical protein